MKFEDMLRFSKCEVCRCNPMIRCDHSDEREAFCYGAIHSREREGGGGVGTRPISGYRLAAEGLKP